MNITFNVPFMTISQFAKQTGLSRAYVAKRTQKGIYPTFKKQSKQESTLINIIELTEQVKAWETA